MKPLEEGDLFSYTENGYKYWAIVKSLKTMSNSFTGIQFRVISVEKFNFNGDLNGFINVTPSVVGETYSVSLAWLYDQILEDPPL